MLLYMCSICSSNRTLISILFIDHMRFFWSLWFFMAPQAKQEASCFCHVNCIQTQVPPHHLCNIMIGLFIGDQSGFFMISSMIVIWDTLVVLLCSLRYPLSGFPPSSEPSCSSSSWSWCGFLHPDLPRSAAFNCVWSRTCFHLRAPHFQLFLLLFVFSGSNNFVPFLILCNNYGSAMLQIFSSPRLYFVFFARLSLIIHRQRMENFTAICSCWMNPSYCFVSHRQNSSDGSFVVLNVIWLLLWQATYHGGGGGVTSSQTHCPRALLQIAAVRCPEYFEMLFVHIYAS